MRNTFFENYIFSDKELVKNIWNDAIIVLDTNVLLHLYRYSEEYKENLLNVLEHYKDRLWIPYQIGWEYHQNRSSVYIDIDIAYDQIIASLESGLIEFLKKLNLSKYSRHPKIDINWFENQIRSTIVGLCDHLRNMKDSCSDNSKIDAINERITELFDGKVGNDFDDSKLNKLYKDGQIRYSEKTPPGYCDAKEKKDRGNRHLYGDLIWWKQVLEYAQEKGSNVILVTDDTKEDWYEKVKGKTIGPRKELIKEFRNETQKNILIYPTPRFLEYAKENMSVSVNYWTVPISSANPDAAVKFLDLMYKNHELGNLISWGIEDYNYKMSDTENIIEMDPDHYYKGEFCLWGDNRYIYLDNPLLTMDRFENFTADCAANTSVAAGYGYDSSKMSNQLIAIQGVLAEYLPSLETGSSADLEGTYQEFIRKLKDAGIDEVIADNQAQLDAWLAGQN